MFAPVPEQEDAISPRPAIVEQEIFSAPAGEIRRDIEKPQRSVVGDNTALAVGLRALLRFIGGVLRGPLKLVGIWEGVRHASPVPRAMLIHCAGWRYAGCAAIRLNYSVADCRCVLSRITGLAVRPMGAEVNNVATWAHSSGNCESGASEIAIRAVAFPPRERSPAKDFR